ncbi:MAG: hypothetical protein ABI587_10245 [Gemmatimonadales bacterium]
MQVGRTPPVGGPLHRWLSAAFALSLFVACVGDDPAGPGRIPSSLIKVAGDSQQVTVGTTAALPLVVKITDAGGTPVSGVLINFTVDSAGGSVSPNAVTTGPDGRAAGRWQAPTVAGAFRAVARASAIDSIVFTVNAAAGPATQVVMVRGDSQSTILNQRLDSLVGVRVLDAYGNPIRGEAVTFAAPRGHGVPLPAQIVTDAAGLGSTTWYLGDSAGPVLLRAVVDTLPPVTFHATSRYVTAPLVDFALGDEHGCAVISVGTARCWGVNRAGEVTPSFEVEYLPVDAGGGLSARSITAGNDHSCVIATDDQTYCWGDPSLIGAAAPSSGTAPVLVDGDHRFVAIAAGFNHSCGVDADGAGWCWGWNEHGQLGDGTIGTAPSVPVRVGGTARFAWLSPGQGFTCGLSREGMVYCWGLNDQGQLLLPASADVPTPTLVSSRVFLALESGSEHVCAIALDHMGFCWGSNGGGKLGGGPAPVATPLVPIAGGHRFSAISAGGEHSCAVELDGTLYCWGANLHGAIGGGAPDFNLSPVALSPGGFGAVSLGYRTSCARTTSGSLYCWGDNRVGQTGLGPTGLQLTPSAVVSATPFRSITAGGNHTCAESTSQVPICWGANFHGEVGVTISGRPEALPTTAIGGQTVGSLAAGYSHSCAMLATGAACWGDAELGAGPPLGYHADPVLVPGGEGWRDIATSLERSCGLAADSSAFCWGDRTVPTAVPGGTRFTSLVVGEAMSCGLQGSGEIDCWTEANPVTPPVSMGSGFVKVTTQAYGACGLDAAGLATCWTADLVPAPLPTSLRFLSLAGGASGATCGVATDGKAWCWGANNFGQIGDGTLTARATPTLVASGRTFIMISAGYDHSCALEATGAAFCWGMNWYGQVGNGGSAAVPVPTLVF